MAKGLFTGALLFLVGVAIVAERVGAPLAAPVAPPPAATPAASPDVVENFAASVTLERAADSHFYADAQVNGARIRFLVDTGATGIVLRREDALRAGIGAGDYSATGIGAGGEVRLKPVTLDRIALGSLAANNVPAMVAEEGLAVSLLGQSWLARLGSVMIEGDRMVLR